MKINQSLLNRIMKYYTLTTLILMFFLPTLVTGVIFIQKRDAIHMDISRVVKSLTLSINERANETARFAQILTSDARWEEELNRYFTETYSQHHTHYLLNRARGLFLPNEVSRQYTNNRYLDSVQIVYRDSNEVFVSTKKQYFGSKKDQLLPNDGLVITEPLRSILSFETIGQLVMTYSLENIIGDSLIDNEGAVIIYDPMTKKINKIGNLQSKSSDDLNERTSIEKKINKLQGSYYIGDELSNSGHHVIYLVPKKTLVIYILKIMLMIFSICFLTAGVISYYIFKQLKNYANQVSDILETTNRIEHGQIYYRINENGKEAELKQITQAINAMLDGQQESIKQVYLLQMQNNEAVLKALQAQINPHFLYNTLEFIRMSAYLDGSDELAEFVYDFSILLRNNITDEKEKSIAEEIYFVQKYINLYQARYPEKLSVYIELDEAIKEVIIPKFTLQPLVENYLVHGVDFSHNDNELTISITQQHHQIVIEISDNGRGIEDSYREQLNQMILEMLNSPLQLKANHQRLGISIVAQRLRQKFGRSMKMYYETNERKGVTLWIHLPIKKNIMF